MEQELSFQKRLQKKTKTSTKKKTKTETKTKTKAETKTKTKTKSEKDPTCAIFSESRGCKDIKYDLFTKNVECQKSNIKFFTKFGENLSLCDSLNLSPDMVPYLSPNLVSH